MRHGHLQTSIIAHLEQQGGWVPLTKIPVSRPGKPTPLPSSVRRAANMLAREGSLVLELRQPAPNAPAVLHVRQPVRMLA